MPEPTGIGNNRALLKRTVIVAGAMVGACIFIVGALTLIAVTIVDHAVGNDGSDGGGTAMQGPGNAVHPAGGSGPRPVSPTIGTQRK